RGRHEALRGGRRRPEDIGEVIDRRLPPFLDRVERVAELGAPESRQAGGRELFEEIAELLRRGLLRRLGVLGGSGRGRGGFLLELRALLGELAVLVLEAGQLFRRDNRGRGRRSFHGLCGGPGQKKRERRRRGSGDQAGQDSGSKRAVHQRLLLQLLNDFLERSKALIRILRQAVMNH